MNSLMKYSLLFILSFSFSLGLAQTEETQNFEGELLYKFETDSIVDSGIREQLDRKERNSSRAAAVTIVVLIIAIASIWYFGQ